MNNKHVYREFPLITNIFSGLNSLFVFKFTNSCIEIQRLRLISGNALCSLQLVHEDRWSNKTQFVMYSFQTCIDHLKKKTHQANITDALNWYMNWWVWRPTFRTVAWSYKVEKFIISLWRYVQHVYDLENWVARLNTEDNHCLQILTYSLLYYSNLQIVFTKELCFYNHTNMSLFKCVTGYFKDRKWNDTRAIFFNLSKE